MELLTSELRAVVPTLYTNKDMPLKDQIVHIKFSHPVSGWVWYATEGSAVDEDGERNSGKPEFDFYFFGYVIGFEAEAGYFSLRELTENGVQRDRDFKTQRLGSLIA